MGDLFASLKKGVWLNALEKTTFNGYTITSNRKYSTNSIYITHYDYRGVAKKALIHIEGHTHMGQRNQNYLNIGFLYRDSSHGAKPLIGCYWTLEFDVDTITTKWHDLDNKMKEYICSIHTKEGKYYVPYYYQKCPACIDDKHAKFSK